MLTFAAAVVFGSVKLYDVNGNKKCFRVEAEANAVDSAAVMVCVACSDFYMRCA
jgi:hypothetical protein